MPQQTNTQTNTSSLTDSTSIAKKAHQVLDFWFDEAHQPLWFKKDKKFDQAIRDQFYETWLAAKAGECGWWRDTVEGAVAEIIVLDQFSRNLCRNSPQAFAQDGMALVLAQEIIKREGFETLPMAYRQFAIMPFMHSESKQIHIKALALFETLGHDTSLKFEKQHKAIIDRFGRYPHRNEVLGRESTPEEIEFLKQPNSSF